MASVLPKATTTGRVNLEHITHLHLNLADVRQFLDTAIAAHHPVDARQATVPTCHAKGRMHTPVRQDTRCHWLEKANTPHTAVAAMPAPRTT